MCKVLNQLLDSGLPKLRILMSVSLVGVMFSKDATSDGDDVITSEATTSDSNDVIGCLVTSAAEGAVSVLVIATEGVVSWTLWSVGVTDSSIDSTAQ